MKKHRVTRWQKLRLLYEDDWKPARVADMLGVSLAYVTRWFRLWDNEYGS